jgi:hypothetical protein
MIKTIPSVLPISPYQCTMGISQLGGSPRFGDLASASHVVNATRARVNHVVREVDEELSEASLGCSIVTENGREGCIPEGFGETLAKSFTCSGIIAESERGTISNNVHITQ